MSHDGKQTYEHEFESPKGDRAQAFTNLLARAQLKGLEGHSIKLMEEGATKPHFYGSTSSLAATPPAVRQPRDTSHYKRFLVTLLPTPMSRNIVSINVKTENFSEALRAVMSMHGVATTEQAGGFVVESYSESGQTMVELQKNRHILEKGGYTFSGITKMNAVTTLPAVVSGPVVRRLPGWEYNKEHSTRIIVPARQQAVESIATVISILKDHTPVVKKAYTVQKA